MPRSFAPRPREEPQRKRKPFSWNKVQTQRVEAPSSGGVSIRLSETCTMVLIPLPFIGVGCSVGKKPANGDLFEPMHEPGVAGDWKEDSTTP